MSEKLEKFMICSHADRCNNKACFRIKRHIEVTGCDSTPKELGFRPCEFLKEAKCISLKNIDLKFKKLTEELFGKETTL